MRGPDRLLLLAVVALLLACWLKGEPLR